MVGSQPLIINDKSWPCLTPIRNNKDAPAITGRLVRLLKKRVLTSWGANWIQLMCITSWYLHPSGISTARVHCYESILSETQAKNPKNPLRSFRSDHKERRFPTKQSGRLGISRGKDREGIRTAWDTRILIMEMIPTRDWRLSSSAIQGHPRAPPAKRAKVQVILWRPSYEGTSLNQPLVLVAASTLLR